MENNALEIKKQLEFINNQIYYWQFIAKLDKSRFDLSVKNVDSLVEKKRILVENLKNLDIEYLI